MSKPCTNCGKCCREAVCKIGELILGCADLPCVALIERDGKWLCSYIVAEKEGIDKGLLTHDLIAQGLGVGKGCGYEEEG